MSVTFTTSYKETLQPLVVEKIDELLEENYDLEAMLKFIDEYDAEDEFIECYEEYVRVGEAIGYEAIDALLSEDGLDLDNIQDADQRYQGEFSSTEEFAEWWVTDVLGEHVPDLVYPDWQQTWDSMLYYDFTAYGEGWNGFYIFKDRI